MRGFRADRIILDEALETAAPDLVVVIAPTLSAYTLWKRRFRHIYGENVRFKMVLNSRRLVGMGNDFHLAWVYGPPYGAEYPHLLNRVDVLRARGPFLSERHFTV